MRSTSVKGLDDGLKLELGGDVSLISEIMERGRGAGELIYKLDVDGAELCAIIRKYKLPVIADGLCAKVTPGNRYELTAYDW